MAHLENHAVGNARESVSDVPRRWRLFLGFAFALAVEDVTLGSALRLVMETKFSFTMGHSGFEPETSVLSGLRSNQLS